MRDQLPAVRQMPRPFIPEGDGPMRDAILGLIEAAPANQKKDWALALSVMSLRLIGKNAMLPSEKRIALGAADAVEGLISSIVRRRLASLFKEPKP